MGKHPKRSCNFAAQNKKAAAMEMELPDNAPGVEADIERIRSDFEKAMTLSWQIFDREALRLSRRSAFCCET
jgi:hypothetical protein